jgi:hypothetical protein
MPTTTEKSIANRIQALCELLEREPQRWYEAMPFDTAEHCPPAEHDWIVSPHVYRDEAGISLTRACAKCGCTEEAALWFAELDQGEPVIDLYAGVHRVIAAGRMTELAQFIDAILREAAEDESAA